MIENIRKYTGLIFIVIVVLILGFVFMDTSGFFAGNVGGGGPFIKVGKTTYSRNQFTTLGSSPLQLASGLRSFDENGLEIMRFTNTLAGAAQTEDQAVQQFFAGRMIIREARNEFGVHPSDAEVSEFVRGLSTFREGADPMGGPGGEGEFDQARYNNFIENQIGRFGMSETDFQDLIRDVIATSKLREIIGGGLSGSRDVAAAMAVVNAQQVEVAISTIDTAPYREAIQPTDEELREYWETVKDAFMTEKRIKVSYFIASPEATDETAEPAAEDAEDAEADIAAEEEAPAAEEPEIDADKQLAIEVDSFLNELTEAEGDGFEELVEESGWELVSTDWFTRETMPEDLQLTPRATSAGKQVVDYLFELTLGPDELAPFSSAIAVGKGEWLLARLDDLEEPRVKTFEEAKDEVRERYIEEKAIEAVEEVVEEKTATIEAALEADKSYAEAAEEAGLEATALGPFAISDTLEGQPDARAIFTNASTVDPGELAEPLYQDDRAVIIYVKDRQIVKDDNRGQQIDNFLSNLANQYENAAFSAWLNQRIELAGVQLVGR